MLRAHQTGVSMIELLITIIVMSFGFLSLASFQMRTMSDLTNNERQYLATGIAANVGEKVRANRNNLNDYNGVDTDDARDCGDPDEITANGPCSLAERDIWQFAQTLQDEGFEDGTGSIVIGANTATITLSWNERLRFDKDNPDGEEYQYRLQVPL